MSIKITEVTSSQGQLELENLKKNLVNRLFQWDEAVLAEAQKFTEEHDTLHGWCGGFGSSPFWYFEVSTGSTGPSLLAKCIKCKIETYIYDAWKHF